MIDKNDVLLVPFDFTTIAHKALEHAIGLAKHLGHDICLLHILPMSTNTIVAKQDKINTNNYKDKLEQIIRSISETQKIYAYYILREGDIFEDIALIGKEINAKFIVMGTHGKKGLQYIMGSWAMKVMSASEIPFIVVQNKALRNGYNNIVFPVDSSIESKQKAKWAVYIAKTFYSIVHIITTNETDDELAAKVQRNIKQITKFFKDNNIDFIIKVDEQKGGNFAKSVVVMAKNINADMIMIMTSHDSVLRRFSWGKWDEQILFNTAQIPVLCVNPRDFRSND